MSKKAWSPPERLVAALVASVAASFSGSADTHGESSGVLRPLSLREVSINGGFWGPKLRVIREVTIHDVLSKFEKDRGGAFANFDRVRDAQRGGHAGPPWFDGLVYETLRAASDILAYRYDGVLDPRLDGYIRRIAAAAACDPNGYINTWTQLVAPETRWGTNGGFLRAQHDVYNAGALVNAGIHHWRGTGKTTLLAVAAKFANHMCNLVGPSPKKNIVPAHSLPEEALVDLYVLFRDTPDLKTRLSVPVDERRYLELAEFWIENRGRHCD